MSELEKQKALSEMLNFEFSCLNLKAICYCQNEFRGVEHWAYKPDLKGKIIGRFGKHAVFLEGGTILEVDSSFLKIHTIRDEKLVIPLGSIIKADEQKD